MEDGIINPDSRVGKQLGFTSDKFDGWLWKVGNYIYISFIISKQPGHSNFSMLIKNIQEKGFGLKVPTPFPLMESILRAKGFTKTTEYHQDENIEVWVLETDSKK